MKEPQRYILKKLLIGLCCILTFIEPFFLYAQDDGDSVASLSDSSIITDTTHNEEVENKPVNEVVLRSVPDTTVERMKREKAFAYANDPAFWVKQKRVYRKGFWDYVFDFFTSRELRFIFYTVLIGLGIFVLYRIIINNDLLAFKKSKKSKILFDDPGSAEADRDTIDAKILEAIDQKDFQMAVRYLFFKTLYKLNDKNWIQFHPEATNNQYLNQMKDHKRNQDFRFLTRIYEYVWYGKFQITEQQFSLVQTSFKNFHASL